MESQKLFNEKESEDIKSELRAEIKDILKDFRKCLNMLDEDVKKIDLTYNAVLDIRDRLTGIENCLINKGFLVSEVIDRNDNAPT